MLMQATSYNGGAHCELAAAGSAKEYLQTKAWLALALAVDKAKRAYKPPIIANRLLNRATG